MRALVPSKPGCLEIIGTFSVLMHLESYLGLIFIEADPETRIWGQGMFLGGGPRKHWQMRVSKTGKPIKGCLSGHLLPGQLEFSPAGDFGRAECAFRVIATEGQGRQGDIEPPNSSSTLVEGCFQRH